MELLLFTASGTQDISCPFLCLILPGYELYTVEDCFGSTDNSGVFSSALVAEGNSVLTSPRDIRDARHFTAVQTSGLVESSVQFEGKPRHQDTQDMSHPLTELGVSERLVVLGRRREDEEGKKKAAVCSMCCFCCCSDEFSSSPWGRGGEREKGSRADLLSPSHLSIIYLSSIVYMPTRALSASPLLNHPCIFSRYPYILCLASLCASPLPFPHPHPHCTPFCLQMNVAAFLFFFTLHLGGLVMEEAKKMKPSRKGEKRKFFPIALLGILLFHHG